MAGRSAGRNYRGALSCGTEKIERGRRACRLAGDKLEHLCLGTEGRMKRAGAWLLRRQNKNRYIAFIGHFNACLHIES